MIVGQATDQHNTAEFFSGLLLDEQSGLSHIKKEQAAQFVLADICENSYQTTDSSIVKNLKQLEPTHFAQWVRRPLIDRLLTALPSTLKHYFFFAGEELIQNWQEHLLEMVMIRGHLGWNREQLISITLIGVGKEAIVGWATERLSLPFWLVPVAGFWWGGYEHQFSRTQSDHILNTHTASPRHLLLAHSGFALTIGGSQNF